MLGNCDPNGVWHMVIGVAGRLLI